MSRVKMNAKHEYEFLANYKILQNVYKAHKIDKVSGVGELYKMIMRDTEMFSSRYGADTGGTTCEVQDAVSHTFDQVIARQHSTHTICLCARTDTGHNRH